MICSDKTVPGNPRVWILHPYCDFTGLPRLLPGWPPLLNTFKIYKYTFVSMNFNRASLVGKPFYLICVFNSHLESGSTWDIKTTVFPPLNIYYFITELYLECFGFKWQKNFLKVEATKRNLVYFKTLIQNITLSNKLMIQNIINDWHRINSGHHWSHPSPYLILTSFLHSSGWKIKWV